MHQVENLSVKGALIQKNLDFFINVFSDATYVLMGVAKKAFESDPEFLNPNNLVYKDLYLQLEALLQAQET